MKHKKEIQDELADLSPLLAELKREEVGMNVPENYFDYLTESIIEQAALIPKPATPTVPTSKPIWYAFLFKKQVLGGLAMTLLVLTTVLFFRNQPIAEPTFAEISSEEAAAYIAAHLEDFETTLFTEGDFIEEINDEALEDSEIDLYLEEIIEDLDVETLEELLYFNWICSKRQSKGASQSKKNCFYHRKITINP